WLGHYPHRDELSTLMQHLASREAPPLSPNYIEEASKSIPQWIEGHNEAMRIIWLIWTTSTQCTLWLVRSKEIFEAEQQSAQKVKRVLWKSADVPTQSVIRGMVSQPATRQLGFMVAQCHAAFIAMQRSTIRVAQLGSYLSLEEASKKQERSMCTFGKCSSKGFINWNDPKETNDGDPNDTGIDSRSDS
ncbi:hypothetical protein PHMEG_00015969, partial [Phytophthora megakarya]